jgi:hypothetical protein
MRHGLLALITATIWLSVYGWFFHREILRWWFGRTARRMAKAQRRAEAVARYERWTRTLGVPPPSAEPPQPEPPPPAALPPPVPPRSAEVVPFPRGRAKGR